VRIWLWTIAALVAAIAIVGGATRLTDSGLSITEWRPIMGAIPPLTDADWHDAFEKYKLIPEYKIVNKDITLEGFKEIFWWEWGHRFLGRLVGVVFAIPFLVFAVGGMIPKGYGPRLVSIFALGGMQGVIGWYMVQSGLTERVDVSQYRLALHLGLAIVILGMVLWTALALAPARDGVASLRTVTAADRRRAHIVLGCIFLQIIAGAFVAGMKAGLMYNTWPTMNGELVPGGLFAMSPWFSNLFENATTVQFNHRLLAYVVAMVVAWHAIPLMRRADEPVVRTSSGLLLAAVFGQIALGIWTLLAQVPLALGLAHQAGAVTLFALAVWHLWHVRAATAAHDR